MNQHEHRTEKLVAGLDPASDAVSGQSDAQDMDTTDTRRSLLAMGRGAREAARQLALASAAVKNEALAHMADAILSDKALIARENQADLAAASTKDLKSSFIDRLTLTPERIEGMAKGLDEIRALPDPVGDVTDRWTRP